MTKLPPLNALRAFEASGRHLNFRRAADELGVSQGAVAQQVRGLEAQLQTQLFFRQARGLSLTDDGRRYLVPMRRAFELMTQATEEISKKDRFITISSTPSFATKWLVPRFGDLASTYPDLRVRLDASNVLANFQSDGVDIAIRQGTPPFGVGLVAEPLLSSEVIAVCHPDLISGSSPVLNPIDILHHVLLMDTHGFWALLLADIFGDQLIPDLRTIKFSQTALAIDAALAGQGIALTNKAFVELDLQQGRLCQPFDHTVKNDLGYYVVTPRHSRNPKVVRDVRAWLVKQAGLSDVLTCNS